MARPRIKLSCSAPETREDAPAGRDLVATASPMADWDRARDVLIHQIDAIRGDLDWDLRRKIRDLLALVADLVLFLPSAGVEGQAGIKAEIDALLGQVAALKSRLQG
jgi:hypothetical protein